jgi:hypothetical protein
MGRSEDEVRAAIEICLAECQGRNSPVVKLAEFVEKLRAEGWEAADIRRVESLVLKVLAALLSPEDDRNEAELPDWG